ncbi:leucine-rich repeat extensin-like protein 5 [Chrysoperla carnea]|uniref:leucine-rich repeat extensin-like protein 5 n=1 Tax=Chrysoperla carnea TaxID=189513 RepID=UPI001D07B069|nr:leucine-rich repeat extensin-like protein 5 [Chrysoperla carnea]
MYINKIVIMSKHFIVYALMVTLLIIYNVNLSTSKNINRNINFECGHFREFSDTTSSTTPGYGCSDPTTATPSPSTPPCGCTDPTSPPMSSTSSPSCLPSTSTEPPLPPCPDPPAVIPNPYPECPLVANPKVDVLKPLPKCCQFVHCDNFGVGHVKNCAPSDPPLVFSPFQNQCVWPWEAGNIACDPCTC